MGLSQALPHASPACSWPRVLSLLRCQRWHVKLAAASHPSAHPLLRASCQLSRHIGVPAHLPGCTERGSAGLRHWVLAAGAASSAPAANRDGSRKKPRCGVLVCSPPAEGRPWLRENILQPFERGLSTPVTAEIASPHRTVSPHCPDSTGSFGVVSNSSHLPQEGGSTREQRQANFFLQMTRKIAG